MKPITKLMIKEYNLHKLGYDFMGFTFRRQTQLSFHHLIIPKRECKLYQMEEEGYVRWNGAILVKNTSHEYLHVIEQYDREMFEYISNQMIIMNENGALDEYRLRQIGMVLRKFESTHSGLKNNRGRKLIKSTYHNRLF